MKAPIWCLQQATLWTCTLDTSWDTAISPPIKPGEPPVLPFPTRGWAFLRLKSKSETGCPLPEVAAADWPRCRRSFLRLQRTSWTGHQLRARFSKSAKGSTEMSSQPRMLSSIKVKVIFKIDFIDQIGQLRQMRNGLHDCQLRAPVNIHFDHHIVVFSDAGLQHAKEASAPKAQQKQRSLSWTCCYMLVAASSFWLLSLISTFFTQNKHLKPKTMTKWSVFAGVLREISLRWLWTVVLHHWSVEEPETGANMIRQGVPEILMVNRLDLLRMGDICAARKRMPILHIQVREPC